MNTLEEIGTSSSLEVKLLNLIFVFEKPNKYCKGEQQPSARSPVSDRKGEFARWMCNDLSSATPQTKSLKSTAACYNSKKQHEYWGLHHFFFVVPHQGKEN